MFLGDDQSSVGQTRDLYVFEMTSSCVIFGSYIECPVFSNHTFSVLCLRERVATVHGTVITIKILNLKDGWED